MYFLKKLCYINSSTTFDQNYIMSNALNQTQLNGAHRVVAQFVRSHEQHDSFISRDLDQTSFIRGYGYQT